MPKKKEPEKDFSYSFPGSNNSKNGEEKEGTETSTNAILKFGMNFKKKQRIMSLKMFKEEELFMMEKFNQDMINMDKNTSCSDAEMVDNFTNASASDIFLKKQKTRLEKNHSNKSPQNSSVSLGQVGSNVENANCAISAGANPNNSQSGNSPKSNGKVKNNYAYNKNGYYKNYKNNQNFYNYTNNYKYHKNNPNKNYINYKNKNNYYINNNGKKAILPQQKQTK